MSHVPPSLSVVVPVYNSEGSLEMFVQRLEPVLQAHGAPFELIFVNDGSRDQSWSVVERLVQRHPWIRGINMMRNYGQHNALLCGIRAASHEVVVTMDDDLQHPPEEIPRLLERLAEGHDVVYGRPQEEQHGLWRDLASVVTKMALQAAMGVQTARHVSAFRVLRTHLREAFADFRSPFVSIDVLLTWATTRFSAVLVRHDLRAVGQSNYTFRKLVAHAINMITGFSVLPLQLATVLGFACTLFGLGVLLYVLIRYFISGTSVPGFPFLASTISIFSGAQLFTLGIIGEYLARMHFRIMDRPSYAVRERLGPRAGAE